jgi:hypothetical protein
MNIKALAWAGAYGLTVWAAVWWLGTWAWQVLTLAH